jgi:hypothetical protein
MTIRIIMLKFEGDQTELVELPVIIVNGAVQLISPEFKKLSVDVLADMALAMDGEIGYLKVRAHYQPIEGQHCVVKNCWRPAVNSGYKCDTHEL